MNRDELRTRPFRRILLIKPSAVGDVVHTLPLLVKLRARYPAARIDWLISPENADLVRHHPALSNVVLFPRRELARFGLRWSATMGPFRLLSALRRARYDLVVDMHGQLRSALLAMATAAPVRIGYDRPVGHPSGESCRHGWTGAREGAWVAYTHRIPIANLDVHAVDRYLWIGPMLGLDDGPPVHRIHLPPGIGPTIDALLEPHGLAGRPFAALVPGTIWETKHWHVAGFAEVARAMRDRGLGVVLIGTARDRGRCTAIAEGCPGVVDLSGQTSVAGLVELVRRAEVCVTNDSGSMHIAVAMGRPVVSVFGPTDPVKIGPYGRPGAVVRADVACSPCYLKTLRNCRHGHACINEVSGAMVVERVGQVLGT